MKKKQIILLLTSCLMFCLAGDLIAEKSEETEKKKRFIAAPLVFYTPETSMAFGGAGSYIFRLSMDKNARPSTISPLFIYTLNKQFNAQIKTDMFFKNDNYRLVTLINIQKYPDKFYGIGKYTQDEDVENFSSNSTLFTLSFQKKIKPNFNIGLEYEYMNWTILETQAGGKLDMGGISGSAGGVISGFGIILVLDTRDNIFSTLSGNFFELKARTFTGFFGSDFIYTDISLDIRNYFPIFSSHVVAVQTKIRVQTGDVPFLSMSQLGGEFNMRGYYSGRYRDKNMFLFQTEYRRPLFWRIGLVGFLGLGTVADKLNQLDLRDMKFSYGVGLRFLFDKKERIQIRIDLGFGEDGSSIYFSIFEAF